MKPQPIRPAAIGRAANLAAKVAELEAALEAERRKLAGVQVELTDALRRTGEAEANAKYWRASADAARAFEFRYRDTIIGMGHALADLKLAEADLEADGR